MRKKVSKKLLKLMILGRSDAIIAQKQGVSVVVSSIHGGGLSSGFDGRARGVGWRFILWDTLG
jgi:hypothetical protein